MSVQPRCCGRGWSTRCASIHDIADEIAQASNRIAEALLDWADGQLVSGRMTDDGHDALQEVLHAAGGPAPVPLAR